MNSMKLVALVLIAAGVLALVYGGFTYTKETRDVSIGSMEISIDDKRRVTVPVWAGVILVVAGGGLLLFGGGRRE
jgi:TRAP-type C4-dicarboxylate transport system permease small subunit